MSEVIARTFVSAAERSARSCKLMYEGTPTAVRIPRMMSTVTSSISVNPCSSVAELRSKRERRVGEGVGGGELGTFPHDRQARPSDKARDAGGLLQTVIHSWGLLG